MKFVHSPVLSTALPLWRSRLVLLVLIASFLLLIGWSFNLQIMESNFLQGKGASRYSRVIELSATRGRILDRHGEALAVSTPVKSIWAIPEDARLQPAQARQLAALLDMNVRELNHKLGSERDFVFIKRQVAPDVAEKVAALKLPGINEQREYRRYYPAAEVTAHLLGFTGAEDVGQEGVELAFQEQLAGRPGSRRVIKDRRGQIVEDVESIRKPQEGRDITLAIDAKIQYLAYANLLRAVTEHKARAGSIVVLDAKKGEILAMVNLPTYNPNNRSQLSGERLRNRAFTDTFEPGSTMKPFTAALALEKGSFRPETLVQTEPGHLKIGPAIIHDTHNYGLINVSQVIQKSSNVGSAKMALSLPAEQMWGMFDALGFGMPLKLGFPGEVGGRLRPYASWRPIEQATMAYGHGMSVTLMQLAHAYMAFARDGDLIPLSLERLERSPTSGRQVFSAQTAREVRAMLESVVMPGGTAPKAQVAGYRVAGKTGTARKLAGQGYTNKYIASFAGFAPASDPRLIIAVMVDEPTAGGYYGGEVAAPVFAQVMAGSLRTLGVAPDADAQSALTTLTATANAPIVEESM
ncbi:transpeptidase involved in septal peptidoglycan synthesis (penicillin-binding protein 3) [Sterolibacterium denitrificans]|uniref:Peptidoglycan D,D-transpeptidase FtsI n=1 Tax=Sterolibacterium denitrificans TaxID=157592 RepID=A0A7Z7HNW1_9PROT|nr:penicillin-binding protein 2 [Sterolibacterium denitrificans]SMB21016.1 transpeptidase involved in septal peptidoglycan synthesis (penicillin-binding protein 3) [Sterolibacterium denitrificans]